MNDRYVEMTLQTRMALVRQVASAHLPPPDTIALARAHGRVLARVPATAPTRAPDRHDLRNAGMLPEPGERFTPPRIALAAALGVSQVSIHRRPTVALLMIGSAHNADLGDMGRTHHDGIRDLLAGLLRADALEPTSWPQLADDPVQIEIAVRDTACAFDIVLACVDGAKGFEQAARIVGQFGAVHFTPRNGEPGATPLLARLDQALVLVMSTEPVSLLGDYLTLVRALIHGLEGAETLELPRRARLAADIVPGARSRFACVALQDTDEASVEAHVVEGDGLPALVAGNALVIIPEGVALLAAGDVVDVLSYR